MIADQDPSEMESASDAGANAVSAPDIGAPQTELAVQKGRYLRLSADFAATFLLHPSNSGRASR
jgi:hypothetical protein